MKPGDLVKIYPSVKGIGGAFALVLEVSLKDPRLDGRVLVLLGGKRRYMFKSLIEVFDETG
jgi:hypothetical protein